MRTRRYGRARSRRRGGTRRKKYYTVSRGGIRL